MILRLLCVFLLVTETLGFTVTSKANNFGTQNSFPALYISEEPSPETETVLRTSTAEGEPAPEVKCPDCDLCDGSGR